MVLRMTASEADERAARPGRREPRAPDRPGTGSATVSGLAAARRLRRAAAAARRFRFCFGLPRFPRAGAGAAALAVLAALWSAPPAAAQTSVELVSNLDQTTLTITGARFSRNFANRFTTGSDGGGFKLTHVDMALAVSGAGTAFSVRIQESTATGPGASLGTLITPAALVTGVNRFTAPGGGIDLDSSTTYFVVVEVTGTTDEVNFSSWFFIPGTGEDPGAAAGWSIGDLGWDEVDSGWTTVTGSNAGPFLFALHGYASGDSVSAPDAPSQPTVSQGSNSGSLDVSWTAPAENGSAITDYDLRYYQGSSDPADAADWIVEGDTRGAAPPDPGAATSATLSGLKASTAYRVQVRAANAAGEGAWSASTSATTAAQPTTNNAPRLLEQKTAAPGETIQCRLKTDTSTPSATLIAAAANVVSIRLATRGTETTEWPASCSIGTGNSDPPVFDDRDAETLTYASGYTSPGNVRFLQVPTLSSNRLYVQAVAAGALTDLRVDVTATDPHGASASTHVVFQVSTFPGSAGAPGLGPVGNRRFAANAAVQPFVLPAATGGDLTTALGITIPNPYLYAVSGLPAGLAFDPATRTVSGTPTETGTFTVTYTADDFDGRYSGNDSPTADDLADAAQQSFTIAVETVAGPAIEQVRIDSAPTHDADDDGTFDTYIRGDTIFIDVEFGEPVAVTGDGDVRLRLDVGPDNAAPTDGSRRVLTEYRLLNGGRTLRFAYPVQPGDTDSDGVWVQTARTSDTVLFYPNDATVVSAATGAAAVRTKDGLAQGSGAGDALAKVNGGVTNDDAAVGPKPTAAAVNGETLTVTFSKALNASVDAGRLTWALAVQGAGGYGDDNRNSYQHPLKAAVSGTALTLTLGEPARAGDTVTLSYRRMDGVLLLQGTTTPARPAPTFRHLAVANDTPDATAGRPPGPKPLRASVSGTELTLHFDAALDDSSAPAGSAFTVGTSDPSDDRRSIAGTGTAGVAGDTVTVTLAEAVRHDEVAVVSYARPDSAPLRGAGPGNPAVASFDRFRIETVEDGVAPARLGGGIVETSSSPPKSIVSIYFDELLDESSTPASGDFTVTDDGTARTVSDVTVAGVSVFMTVDMSATSTNQKIVVSYTPGTNPIRDLAGHDAAAFSFTHPSFVPVGEGFRRSPRLDGSLLTVGYGNSSMDPRSVPPTSAFTFHYPLLDGQTAADRQEYYRDIDAVWVRGTGFALRLAHPVWPCAGNPPFTMTYTVPTGTGATPFRTFGGTNYSAFSHVDVTNARASKCVPARAAGSSGPSGSSVTLRFGRTLDATRELAAESFGLSPAAGGGAAGAARGSGAPAVAGAAYAADGDGVVLTLSRALAAGEAVTVSYTGPKSSAGLWDVDGNQLRDFADLPVEAPAAPAVTGVEVVSDAGDDATYARGEAIRVRLTFDEPVEVAGAPRLRIDMDPAHWWGEKWAVYESGSGTDALTFAHEVVEPNVSTKGIAVLADTLQANGGAIRSAATGADAELAHAGLDHDPAHKVDWRLAPPAPNAPATGAPTIAGTAQVGETLTAAAADVADADGLTGASFAWQWVRSDGAADSDIAGATASSYTLAEADEGRTIKVRVAFTDDAGHAETLVSAATAAVAPRAAALTAAFHGMPAEHDGKKRFEFEIRFSEEVKLSFRTLRDSALAVANGRVTKAKRVVKGENRRWAVRVKPLSFEDVTVALPAAADCAAAGAICTPDGRKLSNTVTATVAGPAALSVADAKANEADEALAFTVTLSRAAHAPVTVDYATRDGTAAAGEDYTRTSGTLAFAAGETEKTVNVPLLDDAVDEGAETFTLTLTNAQGARIGDGEATGTIENADPLQKMWLSRFGRTVADHVTAAVSDRLATPLSGAQVTVGGQSVNLAATEDGAMLTQTLTAVARALGAADGPPAANDDPDGFGAFPGSSSGTGLGFRGSPTLDGAPGRLPSGRDLLLGSAFHLAREGDGRAPGMAAWGRVTVGGFDGAAPADAGSVRIDGNVTTGILGADAAWNRLLAGVAVSVSEGKGGFDQPGVDKGSIESTMTTVSPYARFTVSDRVSVWGLAGWGTGDMTIVQDARAAADGRPARPERISRTDLRMRLIAGGGRGALLRADEAGGIDLALKGDAFYVETESEPISNEGRTTASASRVRLALEGSRAFRTEGGGTFTPGLELGLRHDGGDAETGTGVELGGRVSWQDPETGLSVEARGRVLVAHEDSDYREWGASGAVRLAPGERGRGLSFSLSPSWGAASSGVERLWGARDARGLAPDGEFQAEQRLEGELGYGLSLFGDRFTGTPNVGFGFSDTARDWRIGWRLTSAVRNDPGFRVDLDATRREAANGNEPPEHGVMLRGAIRW